MFVLTLRHTLISFICVLLTLSQTALAQTTAFTYQGKLSDNGTPSTGNYDFEFRLFDALSNGTQQGATIQLTNVAVTAGIFTVQLDFGACASCFNGAPRFLDLSVRMTGGGAFTPLSPRQPVTANPYAIKSLNATTADGLSVACVNCVTSSQVQSVSGSAVSGTIPVASVPAGSGNYIQNTTSQQAANFNISGNGTAAGTLSGNLVNTTTQYNLAGSRVLGVSGVGIYVNTNTFAGILAGAQTVPDASGFGSSNSFFGLEAGRSNTTGGSNSFFGLDAGLSNTTGDINSFFGKSAGLRNTTGGQNSFFGFITGRNNETGTGNTFIGTNADFNSIGIGQTGNNNSLLGAVARVNSGLSNATAIGARAQVTASHSLVLGSINGINGCDPFDGCDSVNVGIGTTAPTERLQVVGNTIISGNIGIGTNAPSGRLQVVTANDTDPESILAWDGRHVVIGATANTGGIGMSYDQTNGVGYIEALKPNVAWGKLIIQSGGGRVGIGTTSPDQTLTVNGDASKLGGGSWATYSDERLKNIRGRFDTGLEAVMQLQPLRYEYKTYNTLGIKSEGEHIGFGAQAVQKVIPEAVTKNDKGYLLVNNDPIMWTMLNAIKEQQKEIEQLKAQVRQLRIKTSRGNRPRRRA